MADRRLDRQFRISARRLLRAMSSIAAAALLCSCAELDYLRAKTTQQENTINDLATQGKKWEEAFYKLRDQTLKNYEEYKALLKQRDDEIERLRNRQSDRERKQGQALEQTRFELQEALDKNEELRLKLGTLTETSRKEINSAAKERDAAKANANETAKDLAMSRSEAKTYREQAEASSERIKSLQSQIDKANARIESLESTVEDRDSTIASQQKTIDGLKKNVETAGANSEELARLRSELKKKDGEIARLKKEVAGAGASGRKTAPGLAKAKDEFTSALKQQIEEDTAEVFEGYGGVVVRLQSDLLFAPATVVLEESAKSTLAGIAQVIEKYPDYQLRIEGHTDPQPVRSMPFPDNLALSTQRADNVLRYLMQVAQLPTDTLQIRSTGCSFWEPIAKNDTPEGRRKNRRVEIILMPKD